MSLVYFNMICLTISVSIYGQNQSPYAVFGHTSRVNYDMPAFNLENKNSKAHIKSLAFNFSQYRVCLLGQGDSVLSFYNLKPSQILRFFAIDPLHAQYPHNSPHAFSENKVIDCRELEGAESIKSNTLRFGVYSPGRKERFFAAFETSSDRRYRVGGQQLIEGIARSKIEDVALDYALSDGGPLEGTKLKKWWDSPSKPFTKTIEKIWRVISPIEPMLIYDVAKTYMSPASYDEVITALTVNIMTRYYGATYHPGSTANSYLSAPDASKGFSSQFYSAHAFSYKLNLVYHTLYNHYGGFADEDGNVSDINEAFMKDNLLDIAPDFYKATEALQNSGTRIPDLLTPQAMKRDYMENIKGPEDLNKPIEMPRDGMIIDRKYPILK